jgi:hypothetical protein
VLCLLTCHDRTNATIGINELPSAMAAPVLQPLCSNDVLQPNHGESLIDEKEFRELENAVILADATIAERRLEPAARVEAAGLGPEVAALLAPTAALAPQPGTQRDDDSYNSALQLSPLDLVGLRTAFLRLRAPEMMDARHGIALSVTDLASAQWWVNRHSGNRSKHGSQFGKTMRLNFFCPCPQRLAHIWQVGSACAASSFAL